MMLCEKRKNEMSSKDGDLAKWAALELLRRRDERAGREEPEDREIQRVMLSLDLEGEIRAAAHR